MLILRAQAEGAEALAMLMASGVFGRRGFSAGHWDNSIREA